MTLAPELEPAPFLPEGRDGATALLSGEHRITYAALRELVQERRHELGAARRLVMLEMANDVDSVVTYLAALAGHHPVLLVPPAGPHADLVATYDPDVVIGTGRIEYRRVASAHDLHPDLALLLSTSGTTGSPKLVRLSRHNLRSNAASIAEFLALDADDRGVTSLPLHYCYGLSVLNSHLARGAGVVLTDLSVADECFWSLAASAAVTGLAGVPYTFELLESAGFAERRLPSLRYLTQAGGRMAPERVRAFAELGAERGWELFVMYGQTEATARMAYLPPALAAARPEAVGVPVPGGGLSLADVGPDGVGELVYEGPNVMMGYAEQPADLASGAVVQQLRTGDLGRQADDGLWELVGRRDRSSKLFGLRLDLDHLEAGLADDGVPARVVVTEQRLWAFVDVPRQRDATQQAVVRRSGLPTSAVRVERVDEVPRTARGKVDYAQLCHHAATVAATTTAADDGTATAESVRDLYATVLGRPSATTTDTFVDLGGDSLSYVEVAHRLGEQLGDLPPDWPRRTPVELSRAARRRRSLAPVETSVLLRAAATLLILITHADIAQLQGGAHVLLAVAGYNLARFRLGVAGRGERARGVLRAAGSVAVPTVLWVGGVALLTGAYHWPTVLLLNQVLGERHWTDDWRLWFLETLVWAYVALAALLAVALVDRWTRRAPFGAALVALGLTLGLRFALIGVQAGPTERYSTPDVLWCLALGWAAAAARSRWQQVVVALAAVVAVAGFFGDARRETIVIAGVVLLVAVRRVLVPRVLTRPVHLLAAASLWVYLTQWQVYPELEDAGHPWLAVLASVAVGVAVHLVWVRAGRALRERRRPQSASRRLESVRATLHNGDPSSCAR